MKINKNTKIILLAIFCVAVLLLPAFDNNTYHHVVMNQALVNIVVVMGLNFITGLTGQMNLGTAGIMALGAYAAALTTTKLGLSSWAGFVVSIAVGCLIGVGLGYPSLRLKGVYLALTTIGFSEITRLVLTNWVTLTGGTMGIREIPYINIFGYDLNTSRKVFYLYFFIVLVLGFTANRIVKSKFGRVFKAIRDNADAVESCGINIASLKIQAFTLCTIYGCLGGSMYTYLIGYINPTAFTMDLSANYLVMMMFGGIGSVAGNIIGAAAITILPEILRFMSTYYWLVFSIITLLFAIFLPNGVVSLFTGNKPLGMFWTTRKEKVRRQK